MTSGERMVWAAEFVGMYPRTDSVRAVRRACEAVHALRAAAAGELTTDERAMLDDMLGTGENRKPAREPTHEHSFVGDGCDCALCGEGRAHYLHANGGDR